VQLIGNPPLPWEPVAAAMQGNSYILGLSDTVDPRLEPFVRKQTREERLMEGIPNFADVATVAGALAELDADESEEDLQAEVEALRTGRQRNGKGQFTPQAEG
jgi:hypothetical protein